MTHSELADRIERFPGEIITDTDRKLIVAALRAHALPSEEEIMKAINKGIQREQWRRDKPEGLGIRRRFSAARAVLALLGKTGG